MWKRFSAQAERVGNLWHLYRVVDGIGAVRLYNRLIRGDLSPAARHAGGNANTPANARKIGLRKHPAILLRPYTADAGVFREVILQNEYAVAAAGLRAQSVIVDLGSNIGMSIAAFQMLIESPRIVGIEPDGDNFQLCRLNAENGRGEVKLIQGAVGGDPGFARLSRDGLEIYAFKTEAVDGAATTGADIVRVWTVPEMLAEAGLATESTIDLLKCDIEGAEASLFKAASTAAWIVRVRTIMIELHDPYVLDEFLADLQRLGWSGDVVTRSRRVGCDVCCLRRRA